MMNTPKHVGRSGRYRALSILAVAAWLAAVGIAVLPSARVQAQVGPADVPEPGETVYAIRLNDGSELYARVTAVDGGRIVLTTSGGARVEVETGQIRDIRPARGRFVQDEFWREDPNGTRLFFTSTGRSLRRGEGYVGTYLVVLPFAAVGLTDRVTLAAGAPVLFGEFEPFYVAPKVQLVKTPGVEMSAGVLAFFFDDEMVGITYGVGTFGTRDAALTAGLGFGFSGADFESQPVAMVGGEVRMSRRTKLLTENYFLPGETGAVLSAGVRFLGDRLSTDVGVLGALGDGGGGCCLPMLSFGYAFGAGR